MRTFLIQTTKSSTIICFTESTLVNFFIDRNGDNLRVLTEKHDHLFQFKPDEENELEQIKQFQQKMRVLHKYLSAQSDCQSPYVLDLTDFNLTKYDITVNR